MTPEGHFAAIISAGSNIERERHLPEAIRLLRRHRRIEVRNVSRFFETEPVGGKTGDPRFYNVAIEVVTDLNPEELRSELHHIEDVLERVRTEDKNAPRKIDLDIAFYADVVADFGDWSIPDPDATTAPHVLVPIADVCPKWVDPQSGSTVYDLMVKLEASAESVRPASAIALSTPQWTRAPEDFDSVEEVYAPHFESLVRQQLFDLGEDPEREGLVRTPLRVAKAMDFLTSGYATSLDEVVNNAIFDAEGAEEMVLVRDVEFFSMCEHHMLPFFGRAAVAYLPNKKIIGLSKLARIIDLYGRRLQVQERMTNQVADAVGEVLDPHGVAVVLEGKHFCMMMRGVQKQDSWMVTSAMRGTFRDDARTRNEFLDLMKGQ